MLDIKRSGQIASILSDVRGIPARVIPYAAATALTRTVKSAQTQVIAQIRQDFRGPTRYTLGATRIEPATKAKLSARIAVKDKAGSGATRPESFLLPEVEGGARSEKRFERALRYSGMIKAGQYALPGSAAKLDSYGNVTAATIRTILAALKGVRGGVGAKGQAAGKGKKLKNDLFVGAPTIGRGKGRRLKAGAQEGIWRREGKRLRPLFIFTSRKPQYAQRLDFDGTVSAVVRDRFSVEFARAATDILSRSR